MNAMIRCQCCKRELPSNQYWYRCGTCGYRICTECLNRHTGEYGRGYKCSQCIQGQMQGG